jgi:putative peptidoglycan lipid II flippase
LNTDAQPTTAPRAEHHAALSRAVRAVFSVTLLSRLGGLVREVVIGRIFGDTAVGSAFAAAFAIPNTFRRLFGEGALSAAFIPAYSQALRSIDPRDADRLASLTLAALGLVTGLITLLAELALFALLLALPFDPERDLSLRLIMLMLPFMPLICTVAMLAGMLQVHGRFAASSSGPLVLNALMIAVAGYFLLTNQLAGAPVAYALGAVTVLSGLTQSVWFALLLRRHAHWTRDFAPARPAAIAMFRRFLPVVLGLGTLQLSALADTLIAMWPIWFGPTIAGVDYPLDERSNVILAAMQRLYQFPLGVFGIAVATAAFPMLAKHAEDPELFRQTLRRGLRLSLFIGLPASAGLIITRHELSSVLYGGSNKTGFSAEGLARCASVLAGYAPAVWAYSLNQILTRAFYARGNTTTPTRVAIVMVFVNLALSLSLIWFLREAGMAWATSIAATVQCAVLLTLLARSLGGGLIDPPARAAALRVLAATLLMVGACLLVHALLPTPIRWRDHLLNLAALCGTGALAYAGASLALGLPELRWLVRRSG